MIDEDYTKTIKSSTALPFSKCSRKHMCTKTVCYTALFVSLYLTIIMIMMMMRMRMKICKAQGSSKQTKKKKKKKKKAERSTKNKM